MVIVRRPRAARRDPRREPDRLRVAVGEQHAGLAQRRFLARAGPADRSSVPQTEPTNASSRRALRRGLRARIAGTQLGRRVGVRAVAEHDVEQDHRHLRVRRLLERCARCAGVWSIIGCGRPRVKTSSPRSIDACAPATLPDVRERQLAGRPACSSDRPRHSPSRSSGLVAEGAAAVEAADVALALARAAGLDRGVGAAPRADAALAARRAPRRPAPRPRACARHEGSLPLQLLGSAPRKFTTTGLPARARRVEHRAPRLRAPAAWRSARSPWSRGRARGAPGPAAW